MRDEPTRTLIHPPLPRLLAALGTFLTLLLSAPSARATAPTRDGVFPAAVREAFASGALGTVRPSLPADAARAVLPDGAASTALTQTVWNVPVLMIAYSDRPFAFTAAAFESALFDTTGLNPSGSFAEYWRWASGGRLRARGRVVATVTLSQPAAFYGNNYWGLRLTSTPQNMYGAIREALMACEATVDWSEFDQDLDGYVDMLWVLHAGVGGEAVRDYQSFWSITSRFTAGWTSGAPFVTSDPVPGSSTLKMRIDRFSTVPELSSIVSEGRAEIGVFCHEFGHALGLPDLYDTSSLGGNSNKGPGLWSLMAMGNLGADGLTPESPSHPGAWALKMLGWLDVIRPSRDSLITLPPLATSGRAVEMAFEGGSMLEYYLIENRQRIGFDQHLLSEGLLIHHLDDAGLAIRYAANQINSGLTPGVQLVEADGRYDLYKGLNRGDSRDPFPGSLGITTFDENTVPSATTFAGAPYGVAVRQVESLGDDMRFQLQVRAPGWLPVGDRTPPDFSPLEVYGPARSACTDVGGTVDAVFSETRGGRPQVVLRSRAPDGTWRPETQVSQTTRSALTPSVARLPGGDLAVVWSDTRAGGISRVYYRARLAGAWTEERVLAALDGDAYRPSVATDAHGNVFVTWLQVVGTRLDVAFMRFPYATPYGTVRMLSDSTQVPDDPSVTAAPDGNAVVAWIDRASSPPMFWFARSVPDSGVTRRLALNPLPLRVPSTYTVLLDDGGVLHSVWIESTGGTSEIHYQRRSFRQTGWLRDSLLEVRSEAVQSPALERDPSGTLHLVYQSVASSRQQVRYKRWRAGIGWEAYSTTLTEAEDGYATRPMLAPVSPGRVTMVCTSYLGTETRLLERVRTLDPPPVTDVPSTAPGVPSASALALAPNPARAGATVALGWSGAAAPPPAEVLDVSGRRVATLRWSGGAGGWRARLTGGDTAHWPAGLYLVRAGDAPAARLVVLR